MNGGRGRDGESGYKLYKKEKRRVKNSKACTEMIVTLGPDIWTLPGPRPLVSPGLAPKSTKCVTYRVLRAVYHRRLGRGVAHFAQVYSLVSPREFVFVVNLAITVFAQVRVVVVTEHGRGRGVAQHTGNHALI